MPLNKETKPINTDYQNIAKLLTHLSIIEKAMHTYKQNIAKPLTHLSVIEKDVYTY